MSSNGRLDADPPHAWKSDSIEERAFGAGLICLEGHYMQSPVMGPLSMAKVMNVVSRTMEKTHTFKDVRCVFPSDTCHSSPSRFPTNNSAEKRYQAISEYGCGSGGPYALLSVT